MYILKAFSKDLVDLFKIVVVFLTRFRQASGIKFRELCTASVQLKTVNYLDTLHLSSQNLLSILSVTCLFFV